MSNRIWKGADRDRVRRFFAYYLGDELSGLTVPPETFDSRTGIASHIRTLESPGTGRLLGATFASNNPEDVFSWRAQGEEKAANTIAAEQLLIHQLAVDPTARRKGLGRALVHDVVEDAHAEGASVATVAFNDDRQGLASFYQSAGFTLLERTHTLVLTFTKESHLKVGFPQHDHRYRWAYRILNRSRVEVQTAAN